jgi:MoxR-like ATPase
MTTDTTPASPASANLDRAHAVITTLRHRLRAAVKGRDEIVDLVLVALLADGHVLLEDYPGSGKTTLARALGEGIADDDLAEGIAPFRRIQFTPDLLPSDITGTNIFDMESQRFVFRPGPLFAHVVLADEINRTSPKVQAAMLEAMGEKQVTADNTSHALDALFFVIATQNPLDLAGTYPLPTPQLDRFLFKLVMKHIARDAEIEVLAFVSHAHARAGRRHGAGAPQRAAGGPRDHALGGHHPPAVPRLPGGPGPGAARGPTHAAGRLHALAGAHAAGAPGARAARGA